MLHRQLQGKRGLKHTDWKSLGQSIKEEVQRVKETSKRVKKKRMWAQRNQNRKAGNYQKEGASMSYLQVLWRKSPLWLATSSCLRRQTVGLVEKTIISLNAATPLTETRRMV